jgi:hypothetical protein
MEFDIDPNYKDNALLIRYAAIFLNNREKSESIVGKLIEIVNQMKYFAYPNAFIYKEQDPFIIKCLKSCLTERNSEKEVLQFNQIDTHIIDGIGVTDVEKNKEKILEIYKNFFNSGNFDKVNRGCFKFLSKIIGANEDDININVIRYMISCICMNDYQNCFDIIETVGKNYSKYDYNIYNFILYLVKGDYDKACETIIKIKHNVNDEIYKYFTEKDLAFYFSFCLLFNFTTDNYKKIISDNELLIYRLYYKYHDYFLIVDNYYKCDYLNVNSFFNEKLFIQIKKDPFLSGYLEKIEKKLKKQILKEILVFSNKISLDFIAKILLLKEKDDALKLVNELIKEEKQNIIIDELRGIIMLKEKNRMNEILEKSNMLMKIKLTELVNYSIKKNIKYNIEPHSFTHGRNVKIISLNEHENMNMNKFHHDFHHEFGREFGREFGHEFGHGFPHGFHHRHHPPHHDMDSDDPDL